MNKTIECKSFRRVFSMTLVVMIMSFGLPVQAALTGDYTYTVNDNTAQITGYYGEGSALNIPDTLDNVPVTSIEAEAFSEQRGQNVTSVVIPISVVSIGSAAFDGCTALDHITIESATTEIYNSPSTIPEGATIEGYDPSTAKTYADKYQRKFEAIGVALSQPKPTEITVKVNGDSVDFDQAPISSNGRVLVPLRAIFEALGAQVKWDNATRTVTATKGATNITVVIDNNSPTVNGVSKKLDVPAQIVNGRTLVPVRFISESLGAVVEWNEGTQTVSIK